MAMLSAAAPPMVQARTALLPGSSQVPTFQGHTFPEGCHFGNGRTLFPLSYYPPLFPYIHANSSDNSNEMPDPFTVSKAGDERLLCQATCAAAKKGAPAKQCSKFANPLTGYCGNKHPEIPDDGILPPLLWPVAWTNRGVTHPGKGATSSSGAAVSYPREAETQLAVPPAAGQPAGAAAAAEQTLGEAQRPLDLSTDSVSSVKVEQLKDELEGFVEGVGGMDKPQLWKLLAVKLCREKRIVALPDTADPAYAGFIAMISPYYKLTVPELVGVQDKRGLRRNHGGTAPKAKHELCHELVLDDLARGRMTTVEGLMQGEALRRHLVEACLGAILTACSAPVAALVSAGRDVGVGGHIRANFSPSYDPRSQLGSSEGPYHDSHLQSHHNFLCLSQRPSFPVLVESICACLRIACRLIIAASLAGDQRDGGGGCERLGVLQQVGRRGAGGGRFCFHPTNQSSIWSSVRLGLEWLGLLSSTRSVNIPVDSPIHMASGGGREGGREGGRVRSST